MFVTTGRSFGLRRRMPVAMTKLRLVQNGATSTRPLVIVYHADSSMDQRMRVACGSYPTILNYTATPMKKNYYRIGLNGLQSLRDIYDTWLSEVGAVAFSPIIVAGFSEGCQAVRAHLYEAMLHGGMEPDGTVCVDGVHTTKPVPVQPDKYVAGDGSGWDVGIQPWHFWLGTRLKWGGDDTRSAIFTHSEIDPGTYSSVRATLEYIFGLKFGKALDKETPALHRQGLIDVWSFPGSDAEAHKHQLRFAMPHALNWALCQQGELKEDGPEIQALNKLLKQPLKPDPNLDPKKDPKQDPKKPFPLPKKPAGSSAAPWVVGGTVLAAAGGLGYYAYRRSRKHA